MSNHPSLYKELLHKAVQLLAQRNHSCYELKNKLYAFCQKKFIAEEFDKEATYTDINRVIDECVAKNWLDENKYIEQYITMRARKGYGNNRIVLELKQRGVDDSAAFMVMSEVNIDWIEIGFTQMIKKFGTADKKNRQQKLKIFQFLSYKGFSQEQIKLIYATGT